MIMLFTIYHEALLLKRESYNIEQYALIFSAANL